MLRLNFIMFIVVITIGSVCLAQTNVGGTINVNTTWDLAGSPYTLTSDVLIPNNILLTIDPGVEIFAPLNRTIIVNGILNANGISGNPILFSAVDTTKLWRGVSFATGSSGTMSYCIMEFCTKGVSATNMLPVLSNCTFRKNQTGLYVEGGTPVLNSNNNFESNTYVGINFYNSSSSSISNQTFVNNTGSYGAILMQNCGVFTIGSGNNISGNSWPLSIDMNSAPSAGCILPNAGNTNNGIQIAFSSMSQALSWPDIGVSYILPNTATVGSSGSLTIEAGVIVSVSYSRGLIIQGTLNANGTSDNPILFTAVDTTRLWGGVSFATGSSGTMSHCVIEFCTKGVSATNMLPVLTNCTFRKNQTGLYVAGGTPVLSSINNFEANTQVGINFYNCSRSPTPHLRGLLANQW